MSRIAPDFSALGYHHDPVNGDVAEIAAQAAHLRMTAQRVGEAHEGLDNVLKSDHVSKQLDAILADVTSVSGKLQLVQARYLGAGAALDAYREALAPIQQGADQLAKEATAQHSYDANNYETSAGLSRQMSSATDLAAYERLKADFDEVETKREKARGRVDDAKSALHKLIDQRKTAAETSASSIDNAADSSGLNDTLIDHVTDAIAKIGKFLKDHAALFKTIGDILGWAGLALSIASIFFPPLALVAAIVNGLSGAFSLAAGLGKLLKDGDWGSFALTAVTSVLSMLGAAKAVKAVGKIASLGKMSIPKAMATFGKARGRLVNQLGHSGSRMKAFFRQATGHATPLFKRGTSAIKSVTEFAASRRTLEIIGDSKLLTKLGMSRQSAEQTARVIDIVAPQVGKAAVKLVLPERPSAACITERTYMQVAA